jgi:hypothetical protein
MQQSNNLSDKQEQVLNILMEIIGYSNTSIDGNLYPEHVFTFFVNKYLFFNSQGDASGYVSFLTRESTNKFEETIFFNDICSYLRQKPNKTYIIDVHLKQMLKMLAIPYTFNHFDPRIYDYS